MAMLKAKEFLNHKNVGVRIAIAQDVIKTEMITLFSCL